MTKMPCRITDEWVENPWEEDGIEPTPEEIYQAKIERLANEITKFFSTHQEKYGHPPSYEDTTEVHMNLLSEIFGEVSELDAMSIFIDCSNCVSKKALSKSSIVN